MVGVVRSRIEKVLNRDEGVEEEMISQMRSRKVVSKGARMTALDGLDGACRGWLVGACRGLVLGRCGLAS